MSSTAQITYTDSNGKYIDLSKYWKYTNGVPEVLSGSTHVKIADPVYGIDPADSSSAVYQGRGPINTSAHLAYNNLRNFLGLSSLTLSAIGEHAYKNGMTNNSWQQWVVSSGFDKGVGMYYSMQGAKIGWIKPLSQLPADKQNFDAISNVFIDLQIYARDYPNTTQNGFNEFRYQNENGTVTGANKTYDEVKTFVLNTVATYGHTGFSDYLQADTVNRLNPFISTLRMEPHYAGYMHSKVHGGSNVPNTSKNGSDYTVHSVNHFTVTDFNHTVQNRNDGFVWAQCQPQDNCNIAGFINYFHNILLLKELNNTPQFDNTATPISNPTSIVTSPSSTGSGTLATNGNYLVDALDQPFRIVSCTWSGFELNDFMIDGLNNVEQTITDGAIGYKNHIHKIIDSNFNTLRIPFCGAMLHIDNTMSNYKGKTTSKGRDTSLPLSVDNEFVVTKFNYGNSNNGSVQNADFIDNKPIQALDKIIDYATSKGLRVILARNSCKPSNEKFESYWYIDNDPLYTEDQWVHDWNFLADRYTGENASTYLPNGDPSFVIGFELFNQPRSNWDEWKLATEKCITEISPVNNNTLFFVKGVSGALWHGSNLAALNNNSKLISKSSSNIVYCVNDFDRNSSDFLKSFKRNPVVGDTDFTNEQAYRDEWDRNWGFLWKRITTGYPIMVSEFGTEYYDSNWFTYLIRYIDNPNNISSQDSRKAISYSYFTWNPNYRTIKDIGITSNWINTIDSKLTKLTRISVTSSATVITSTVIGPPEITTKAYEIVANGITIIDLSEMVTNYTRDLPLKYLVQSPLDDTYFVNGEITISLGGSILKIDNGGNYIKITSNSTKTEEFKLKVSQGNNTSSETTVVVSKKTASSSTTPVQSTRLFTLQPGWNNIGIPFDSKLTSTDSTLSKLDNNIYSYDPTQKTYNTFTKGSDFYNGQSLWIKNKDTSEVIITFSSI